jgi:hypothetical protein
MNAISQVIAAIVDQLHQHFNLLEWGNVQQKRSNSGKSAKRTDPIRQNQIQVKTLSLKN